MVCPRVGGNTTETSGARWRPPLAIYVLSTLPVLAGIWFGSTFVERRGPAIQYEPGLINACCSWDGAAYARISRNGYVDPAGAPADVAFFPAYPVLGRAVARVTGLRHETALVLVSNASLCAALLLAWRYVQGRDGAHPRLGGFVVLAMGLWPTTFFFRMAYSDALFVLLTVLTLHAMRQQWPAAVIALIIGLATATRPTGFALLPLFALYLWRRAAAGGDVRRATRRCLAHAAGLLPLACWGVLAYMLFLGVHFSDPLLFLKAQSEWTVRSAVSPWLELRALLTLEPLWSCYVPSTTAHWRRFDPDVPALFSMQFWNPIYFAAAALLLALGAARRWLTEQEWVLGAMLLLVPYVTHSYRAVMMGHARYAAAAFPAFLVLGYVAARTPPPLTAALCGCSGFLLGVNSALFAASHRLI